MRDTDAQPAFLPNVFLLGAAKCATTTLHATLSAHPEICMSNPKEPRFFPCFFEKGIEYYRETWFSHWDGERLVGEAQHRNLLLPHVPKRIHQFNPAAKLLVIVRNPIDRAYSHWWHHFSRREETLDFEKSIREDHKRIKSGRVFEAEAELDCLCQALEQPGNNGYGIYRTYLDCGHYAEQISRYLALFPRDQMRILLYEDLIRDPAPVVEGVLEFLGASQIAREEPLETRNISRGRTVSPALLGVYQTLSLKRLLPAPVRSMGKRVLLKSLERTPMSKRTRDWLRDYYADHNRMLEALLQRDLSFWT